MAMKKISLPLNRKVLQRWYKNIFAFFDFLYFYLKKKTLFFFTFLENIKNILVKFFMMKRGRYNRPFLHIATLGLLAVGVLIAPFIADTYPIFANSSTVQHLPSPGNQDQSISVDNDIFKTESLKIRTAIVTYTVEPGDTISTIAKKFEITINTIKWENDLTGDDLSVGQSIRILPVTGISYKVVSGDTVYTIAKKFDTNAQKIVDWPFNNFANPETFSLVTGQMLLVPDGIKPSEQPFIKQEVYYAQGPVSVSGGGFTWPTNGLITQFASWYHMALDIAAPVGTPIYAAHNGTVTIVQVGGWNYGFGTNVYIDKGDGIVSHYAHMMAVNVGIGQQVIGGKTIVGWIGMTGNTTGPHVHFEIMKNNVKVNPLPYLQ